MECVRKHRPTAEHNKIPSDDSRQYEIEINRFHGKLGKMYRSPRSVNPRKRFLHKMHTSAGSSYRCALLVTGRGGCKRVYILYCMQVFLASTRDVESCCFYLFLPVERIIMSTVTQHTCHGRVIVGCVRDHSLRGRRYYVLHSKRPITCKRTYRRIRPARTVYCTSLYLFCNRKHTISRPVPSPVDRILY